MSLLDFLKTEHHTIHELRQSIARDSNKGLSIIQLLQSHHVYLKECISVLTDPDAPGPEKQAHLAQFLHLLNMHSHAEEETLYKSLADTEEKDARVAGISGETEHELAFQIANELEEMGYEFDWSEKADAKAKVLATLVRQHLISEENETFPVAEESIPSLELKFLGEEYLKKCQASLDFEMSEPRPTPSDSPTLSH